MPFPERIGPLKGELDYQYAEQLPWNKSQLLWP